MIPMEDDEDESREKVLEMLGGEVDDYAGSQLKNPDEAQGVTIEISVKPHGGPGEKEPDGDEEKEPPMADGNEEHDPIAHILGMCRGGCAK